MRFLRQFMEHGTLLFVSHDTAAVVNLCTRAIWLERGAIQAVGRPKEIIEAYLAGVYESQQGPSAVPSTEKSSAAVTDTYETLHDQRLDFLNSSQFRNDIE